MTLNQEYYNALSVHLAIANFSQVSGLSMADIGGKIAYQIATIPHDEREKLAIRAYLVMQHLYQMHLDIMGNNE